MMARAQTRCTRTLLLGGLGMLLLASGGCYERVTRARGLGTSGVSTYEKSRDPVGDFLFGERAAPQSASPRIKPWGGGDRLYKPTIGPIRGARPTRREDRDD